MTSMPKESLDVKTEMGHRSLPWHKNEKRGSYWPYVQMGNEGGFTVHAKRGNETAEELAELIVTACNNHYELVRALEQIIEINRALADDDYGDSDQAEKWSCVLIARAAIARVSQP